MLTLEKAMSLYSKDFIDLIECHFEKLSLNYKMPIFLLIQEKFTIHEVSEILELPVDTIQIKIYSGLNKIKNTLFEEGFSASLDLIWNIIEMVEKVKTPDFVGDMTYFRFIFGKYSSLNDSFKQQQLASPLNSSVI